MSKDKSKQLEDQQKSKEEKDIFCTDYTIEALLKIQKDNLLANGKILGKLGVVVEKIDSIEEGIDKKDHTSSYLRMITFLIVVISALAGIQVGQLTGFWEYLSIFFSG